MKTKIFLAVALMLTLSLSAKKIKKEVFNQVQYGVENTGTTLQITFEKGKEYNHPLFAICLLYTSRCV